jgi:xanthine dehydrogenase molybdenum-binding subunit
MTAELKVVGHRVRKVEGKDKVTGAARYAADLRLPGLCFGKLLRSQRAHAKFRLNVDKALALPGVIAVVTNDGLGELLESLLGVKYRKPPVVFAERARFVGDPIAGVVAESEEIAQQALDLISVEYEELPAVFDPEAAMAPDAPQLHDEYSQNVASHTPLGWGDVGAGLSEADLVVEEVFRTSRQKHCQLEPTATLAHYEPGGTLTVWTPTQLLHIVHYKLARMFGLPLSKVRLVNPHIGGAFGMRVDLVAEHYVAAMSIVAGRPVLLEYSRDEDMYGTETRHPFVIHCTVGVKRDGSLTALQVRSIANTGAYPTVGMYLPIVHGGTMVRAYRCPNVQFDGYAVLTNTPVAGAFRGYGGPQAFFALEQLIDIVADRLGMDPVKIRKQLRHQEGETDPLTRLPLGKVSLDRCLDLGAQEIGWGKYFRRRVREGRWTYGVGVAAVMWVSGTACLPGDEWLEESNVTVKVNPDGSVNVYCGVPDLGTGTRTTLAQLAAEVLSVPVEAVTVVLGDTSVTPFDIGSHASRTLYVTGNGVIQACLDARDQMLKLAGDILEADPQDLRLEDGRIFVAGSRDRGVRVSEVARTAYFKRRIQIYGRGAAPQTNAVPYGAQFAQVAVDTETGQVRVERFVAVHDVGRAINPTIVEGQIEGAILQGIGYALYEDLPVDHTSGSPLATTWMDYKVPTVFEVPEVRVILVEEPDPTGPFGAKGVGEPGIVPTAAAVANAVYDAVGVRVTELPITPEKVLRALGGL